MMKYLFWFLQGAFTITIASEEVVPSVKKWANDQEVKITANSVLEFEGLLRSLDKYVEMLGINDRASY